MSVYNDPDRPESRPGSSAGCPLHREFGHLAAEPASRPPDAEAQPDDRQPLLLEAVRLETRGWAKGWVLRPSPSQRHWMNETPLAYHCLPLVIANQWGWQVLCPTDVLVEWDGSPEPEGLRIEVDEPYRVAVHNRFPSGIVTFSPPWMFRTSPGWDIYVKGPTNRWKPNCVALEGVIETWWMPYTFTLSWKVIEPGIVTFAKGESLCQLVPVPHATFEHARAWEAPIESVEPELAAELRDWTEDRARRSDQPRSFNRFYRRAESIEEHLLRIRVPPVDPL
jgi:hypothetical protein